MPIYTVANTAEDLSASSDFLPKLWKKGVLMAEQRNDFMAQFEGSRPDSAVRVETDLTKGAGQTVVFRTMSGLYWDGVQGDELIDNNVEEWRTGSFELKVDFLRHATRYTLRTLEQTALRQEIEDGIPGELGKWLGRKKTDRAQMAFIHKAAAENVVYAGASSSRETMKSADTIDMNGIISWGQQLKTLGAKPAFMGRNKGNDIKRFCLIGVGEALVSLQQSVDYKSAIHEAGQRGDGNYLFSGGYADVNGHVVKTYDPVDHDGIGSIGSALNAKAWSGEAIAAGTSSFTLKGGGAAYTTMSATAKVQAKFFEFFSNFAYRFSPVDLVTGLTSDRYCLVYNHVESSAGGDQGKFGFYKFVGNDGAELSVTQRLGSATAGSRNTTVGGVTWDTGIWSGKNTANHPIGAPVFETNSYGVPIGRSLMLGGSALCRGYGKYRNERTDETHDGKFVKDLFIMSVFGQTPYKRVDGRAPNFVVVEHALEYAGIPFPTVV
mgnify:FL=1